MNRIVYPGILQGTIAPVASKSHAHRLLKLAAMANAPTVITCATTSNDIDRTIDCLRALGAGITQQGTEITVRPGTPPAQAELPCGESGSTYRFLLPLAAALGVNAVFHLEGRLPLRPMDALTDCLAAGGVTVSGTGTNRVEITGRLRPGTYRLPGHISSQFISGLLMALPLAGGESRVVPTGMLVSRGYVDITAHAMAAFGVHVTEGNGEFVLPAGASYRSPGKTRAEGDWSNAAFWLCGAAACGGTVTMPGLDPDSPQGDKAVLKHLAAFGAQVRADGDTITVSGPVTRPAVIDIDPTPDLAPALALLALAAPGESRLQNIARLREKESDRVAAILAVVHDLGGQAHADGDELVIWGGKPLHGGVTDSHGDHRIVMMAACCAALGERPVTIRGAEAVAKSYPGFFDDLRAMHMDNQEVH